MRRVIYNKEHLTNITTEVYKHLNNAKKAWQVKQQHMSEMHKQGLIGCNRSQNVGQESSGICKEDRKGRLRSSIYSSRLSKLNKFFS